MSTGKLVYNDSLLSSAGKISSSLTKKVLFGSLMKSPITSTVMVLLVSPGLNVRVSAARINSTPDAAVPLAVAVVWAVGAGAPQELARRFPSLARAVR